MKRAIELALFLGAFVGACLFSQATPAADLIVRMFLLPEIAACNPQGYARDEGLSSCRTWSADDVENLFAGAQVKSESTVPPGGVFHLGEPLLTQIRTYHHLCWVLHPCPVPSERLAVMMLFQWSSPQSGRVTFTRGAVAGLKPRVVIGEMHREMRWVDHQRADVFFPALDASWLLQVGSKTWTFVAR